ncbi:hypothetical protein D3C72_1927080 [compost metagenome]
MFSGFKNGLGHGKMCRRNGEIDDDVNVAVGQQFRNGLRLDVIFFGFQFCCVAVQVSAGKNFDPSEKWRQ